MEEYIIKQATTVMLQTWLNQWRHSYHLEVIAMTVLDKERVTMVIKRTPKGDSKPVVKKSIESFSEMDAAAQSGQDHYTEDGPEIGDAPW